MMNRQLRKVATLGVGAYISILSMIEMSPLLVTMAPQKADKTKSLIAAAIFYSDNPKMLEARIDKGVERINSGEVVGLIMIGGSRPRTGQNGAERMANTAIRKGIDPLQIRFDDGSNDTWSNLQSLNHLLKEDPPAKVELVSDRLHLARIHFLLYFSEMHIPTILVPIELQETCVEHFKRLNYEIIAYAIWLMPRFTVKHLLSIYRN